MKFQEQFLRETLPANQRDLGWIHRLVRKVPLVAPLVLALYGAGPASAVGPCTVTSNLDDGGSGTLRALIADADCDPIDFQAGLGSPILLSGTQLTIDRNLAVTGPGPASLAINGSDNSRIFRIDPGSSALISGLTIESGNAFSGGGIENTGTLTLTNSTVSSNSADDRGGGIANTGVLTLANSTVSGNSAVDGAGGIANSGTLVLTNSIVAGNSTEGFAGGIWNDFNATATLTNSTVSGNSTFLENFGATDGGGIVNEGPMTLTNSTVSGNRADRDGGGIRNEFSGTLTLINSTVSGNSAAGPFGDGGAIMNVSGTVTLINSTVSGNSAPGEFGDGGGIQNVNNNTVVHIKNTILADNTHGTNNTQSNCDGFIGGFQSFGHNLSDDGTCTSFTAVGDLQNIAAGLGPLQDNGGPTQTHAVLGGSPAINAISLADCTETDGVTSIASDQRGVTRPQGPTCDIGAFELSISDVVLELVADVLDLNAKTGVVNSLDAKLEAVLAILDDINEHNDVAAINLLQAFINSVEAQRGKHIDEAEADALIASAQTIIVLLGG